MSNYIQALKEIFSHRNIKVLLTSAGLWALSLSMWRSFWPLYAVELGASAEMVGLLSTVLNASHILFVLPGGVLADKFGRKKVILWFTATRTLAPFVLFLANSGSQMIPGLVCLQLGNAYDPAYNSIIAESLPDQGKGAGFGAFRMIRALLNAFAVLMGGVIMDRMGVLSGFRAMLLWSVFIITIVLWIRFKYLVETLPSQEDDGSTEKPPNDRVRSFKQTKDLIILIVVGCLSSFAANMIQPFLIVYAVEIIKLTNTEWGLIQTVLSLIAAVLAVPGGMLSDRIGRKPCIAASRVIGPLSNLGIIFSRNFIQVLIVQSIGGLSAGLGGGGPLNLTGGPAWQALVAELAPAPVRGRVMGVMAMLNGLVGSPSSWIGGYVWDNYNPELIFWLSLFSGIPPILLLIFVREPLKTVGAQPTKS